MLAVFATAMLAVGGGLIYRAIADDFLPPEEVGVNKPAGGARILDRNGAVLYQFVDDETGLRQPVPLEAVSPHLLAATIATEDASFYSNPGLNLEGMGRAVWENMNPGSLLSGSGGSSITQQLVKNIYFTPEQRSQRSLDRKAREAVYSLKLTSRYSKSQILTWYINQISYGGVFNGIEAASQGYFGKPASELTLAEAALLAGIPQAPAAYDPYTRPDAAVERRNAVLDLLASYSDIQVGENARYAVDRSAIEAARQEPLQLTAREPFPLLAPHFVLSYLKPELEARYGAEALLRDGLVITTTLDLGLQHAVEGALEAHISEFEAASNTHNGAAVVIDPRTGELLAMAGSRDYFREDIQGQNNNLLAQNSPGSTLKPFVYLSLFLKESSGPGFLIEDSPISVRQPDGSSFSPRNPGGTVSGWVTVRQALGNSLNIPAFRAAMAVGVQGIVSTARQAGITGLDGSYGPAIAIGGVDVKPLDLAFAYSVLANQGVMRGQTAVTPHAAGERSIDPVAILRVATNDGAVLHEAAASRAERRIVPEEHAFLVSSILRDPQARCQTFGCGGLSVPGIDLAVKTGTSEPFDPRGPNAGKIGETWAFGYTPDVVVGIWAGNADNAPITSITSSSIAFRALRDIVLAYYDGRSETPFPSPPSGLVKVNACYASPKRICIDDYFLADSVARAGLEQRRSTSIGDTLRSAGRSIESGARSLLDGITGLPGRLNGNERDDADDEEEEEPQAEIHRRPTANNGSNSRNAAEQEDSGDSGRRRN